MHVSPEEAGWTTAAAIGLIIYGIALFFTWRHFNPPSSNASGRALMQNGSAGSEQTSVRSAFESRTGGEITAREASMPSAFPFPFARAETGGRIVLDGVKIVSAPEGQQPQDWEPIWKAVEHVNEAIGDSDCKRFWPTARHALRQRALDGLLHVRGRKQVVSRNRYRTEYSAVYTDIPRDYWRDSEIGVLATANETEALAGVHTMPETPDSWHPNDYTAALKFYTGLQVDMAEVARLWPLSSASRYVDKDSIMLSGVVRAVMERAGRADFKVPIPNGDSFLENYARIQNSVHPIWTDSELNQLRRDFLHSCGCVGSAVVEHAVRERQYWAEQLHSSGNKLIRALTGT